MRLLCLLTIICFVICKPTYAASGDTNIRVVYKSQWKRERPKQSEGIGTVNWKIVLHPNGKIDDTWSESNGRTGTRERTLGSGRSGAHFRVVNKNTLARTWDAGSHIETLTIRVAEKSCSAQYEYKLKPGRTEYNHATGAFSYLKMIESQCYIE